MAMAEVGGFDHNAHTLRILTRLESPYPLHQGLNLSWETLEGLAKHNGPIDQPGPLREVISEFEGWRSLDAANWASAEAQVAALADDVAYLNHDIDDGLRAGLIVLSDLKTVPLAAAIVGVSQGLTREEPRIVYEVSRRMITAMISDLVGESRRRLAALDPQSPDAIRGAGHPIIGFSAPMVDEMKKIRAFLFERVYRSSRVNKTMQAAEEVVKGLFSRYFGDEANLPGTWQDDLTGLDEGRRARVIVDFVAGMTDRYALAEHRRLFDATPELR